MGYPYVLLDLDHTLLDSDSSLTRGFADAMRCAGADPGGHYSTFDRINRALWRQVEAGKIKPTVVHVRRFEQLIDLLDLDADPESMADVFATGLGDHGELYDGAMQVLEQLAALSTVGLITNGLSGIQRRRIERLDIARFFDAVVISAEVGEVKPEPAIFDIAFEALGHPPKSEAIMVGDNLGSDIAGGNAYGIATCWYNPGGAPADQAHPPTFEVEHLHEVVAIVSA